MEHLMASVRLSLPWSSKPQMRTCHTRQDLRQMEVLQALAGICRPLVPAARGLGWSDVRPGRQIWEEIADHARRSAHAYGVGMERDRRMGAKVKVRSARRATTMALRAILANTKWAVCTFRRIGGEAGRID
jgi:hypothetical protein